MSNILPPEASPEARSRHELRLRAVRAIYDAKNHGGLTMTMAVARVRAELKEQGQTFNPATLQRWLRLHRSGVLASLELRRPNNSLGRSPQK